MKSILLIILLCISTRALGELGGGTYRRTVTTNTISNLPVLAFVHEREGIIYFNIHVRDIGNLHNFTGAKITVGDKAKGTIFSGYLFTNERKGFKEINFKISEDQIADSSILFVSEIKEPNWCRFPYQMSMNLLYENFKQNDYVVGGGFHPEKSSKIEAFKKKIFNDDRKNPQPVN